MKKYIPDIIPEALVAKENHIRNFLYCAELSGNHEHPISYKRSRNWHYLIICNRGMISLTFDDKVVSVRRGFMSMSNSSFPTFLSTSSAFHGYLVGIDFNTFLDTLRGRGGIPVNYGEGFRRFDAISDIDVNGVRTLSRDCRSLLSSLGNKEHHLAREVSHANYFILLSDIVDQMWTARGKEVARTESLDRGDEIIRRFMREASIHIEKENKVSYYAEALCISKQYLSEVVLKKTGHSIGNVLSTFRYEWSMRYINDPTMTLQQIASQMSFPDQSAFGKFFLKHSGTSPARYRRDHGIMVTR